MSVLSDAISNLASRIANHGETISTEEAVKTSIVLPFFQSLGYDVFNPAEVIPEFTADTIGKKGEKVDYAIQQGGDISILVECKSLNTTLNEKHLSQLYRYFTVTNARFAILTNGRVYQFYTDLKEPHRLDKRPFFTFDISDHNDAALDELAKFAKANFSVENILAQAERLKYVAAIKPILDEFMTNPPEEFVRLIVGMVYDGRSSTAVREMIGTATKAAFREIVRERVRSRLNTALEDPEAEAEEEDQSEPEIITTEDEIEGHLIVKSLLRGSVDSNRVAIRDARSYCAVLLDNNNRKPLARLHFNRSQYYVGLFDGESEDRVPISDLDDMLDFKDRLKATAQKYDKA
ncbi:type I restriction enzyme HsdR N-terminal domain-containing protein [Yoonia sp. GPGPB17]|uniref:type I restriction endonuclease n=1 Tax=Yoonia sp. GPGPB17 TaxID=3026147 RepID=UPI0030BEA8C9